MLILTWFGERSDEGKEINEDSTSSEEWSPLDEENVKPKQKIILMLMAYCKMRMKHLKTQKNEDKIACQVKNIYSKSEILLWVNNERSQYQRSD